MSTAREIDRICDEFEAAWLAGQSPCVDDFLAKIDNEHRPAMLAALMPLDLTYRGKLGETVESGNAVDSEEAGSGFDVTVDSDPGAGGVVANSSIKSSDRVKYFGEYELLSEIARGGMGVVYKARQVKLNRIVALKMILSGEFAGSEAVKRFHSEAEAAANLDHPGIVPIYEIGEHAGQHYFSMGFIDGPSLQGKLNAGPMPAKDAARLCRKIAEAVAYAHSKNVIHRDLKPANVLIDVNGEPKVTDFGLAKKVEGDSGLTRTGAVMGTPSYMPPEQALGQTDNIGPAADVYSLGAILYCMLTGRPPFQAANVVDTLKQVVDNEPVTPRTLDSKIPLDLETICLKCLEKSPANRYATTKEFIDELTRFGKGEPIKARRISRTARTVRWCKRNPVVTSFLALTSALLIVVVISSLREYQQRKLAEAQTILAENAAKKAKDAENKERLARTDVEAERDRAKLAEEAALTAQRNSEKSLAHANYMIATTRWDQNRIGEAKRFLDSVPVEHRRLEWRLTKRKFEGSELTCYGHTAGVFGLDYRFDGEQIATASWDNTIRIWDAETCKVVREIETPRLEGSGVGVISALRFSPDGKRVSVALGQRTDQDSVTTIFSWDIKTGVQQNPLQVKIGYALRVVFSPDETKFATVTNDLDRTKSLAIWDRESGELKRNLLDSQGFIDFSMTFSPDGTLIASRCEDAKVRVWDVTNGVEKIAFANGDRFRGLAFTPDGNRLAIGTDNGVTFFNIETGERLNSLNLDPDFGGFRLTPDGTKIVWGSYSDTLYVSDVATGELLQTLKGHTARINDVVFSPDGSRIASASDDHLVKIWDLTTVDNGFEVLAGEIGLVNNVGVNSAGTHIAAGLNDNSICVWDAKTGEIINRLVGHTDNVFSVAFNPDANLLASGSSDKSIRIWDLATEREVLKIQLNSGGVNNLIFSPDGRSIFSSSGGDIVSDVMWKNDNQIQVWEVSTGEERKSFAGHKTCNVNTLCLSPDGTKLAFGDGRKVFLADAITGRSELLSIASGYVLSVNFSSDGKQIVFGGTDKSIHIFDVEQLYVKTSIEVSDSVGRLSFTPDGSQVAGAIGLSTGEDAQTTNRIAIWDALTGDEVWTSPGSPTRYRSVTLSPEAGRVVSGNDNGAISVWDARRGCETHLLTRSESLITAAATSHDGKLLAISELADSIGVWDLSTFRKVTTLAGHGFGIETDRLLFSEDNEMLYSQSGDSKHVWDVLTGNRLSEEWPSEEVIGELSEDSRWLVMLSKSKRELTLVDREFKKHLGESGYRQFKAEKTIGWHKTQAEAAEKSKDWFSATIHRGWILQLDVNARDAAGVGKLRDSYSQLDPSIQSQLRPFVKEAVSRRNSFVKKLRAVPDGHDNLLPLVDLATTSKWDFKDGLLEGIEKDSSIEFPYTPPDEYRMTAIVEPLDGPFSLLLKQRSGGNSFWVTLAYNNQNSLELVDGAAVPNETTHHGQLLRQGERAEVVVTVKKESVQVSVDGEQIIDWNGNSSRLSLNHQTPSDKALAIHTSGCRYRIHRLSVEPLSGEVSVPAKKVEVEPDDLFGEPADR